MITKGSESVIPHQNWRGQFARGTYADGRPSDCESSQTTGCTPIQWPGYRTTAWHVGAKEPSIQNWFGGLVDGMRDASGQMYMRNRYYDPATGQFTQPDPIGIAGGLNVYGFAAGDPVSNSDPFGLCPCALAVPLVSGSASGAVAAMTGAAAAGAAAIAGYVKRHEISSSVRDLGSTLASLIELGGRRPTQEERDKVNEIGNQEGCMTCGVDEPGTKSGNWVLNHVPPQSMHIPGEPFQGGPHCAHCSASQGGHIRAMLRASPSVVARSENDMPRAGEASRTHCTSNGHCFAP